MTNKSSKVASGREKQRKNRLIFSELAEMFLGAGYEVRREKLHRGPGWQAASGRCTVKGENLVLVDRRIPEDEQIAFLIGEFLRLGIQLDASAVTNLPADLVGQLNQSSR